MEPTNSEVDKFFEGLPSEDKTEADIFGDKKPEVSEKKSDEVDPEEVPESIKNRQHRRLEERLQREREANIALNERLATYSEISKVSKETEGKIDPRLLRAFGTNEAGKEAAQLFQDFIEETKIKTRQETLDEINSREEKSLSEQRKYESYIDDKLESIEDSYGIDLTSNSPKANKARTEFLELVQHLSPKDENGTLTDYADFDSAFEIYQNKNQTKEKVDNSRNREIASRSMTRSQSQTQSPKQVTPGFRGWERDLGIER